MDEITRLRKFWKNKKVLITGHTGFKGSWLIIFLNLLGCKIYGYSLHAKKNSLFFKAKLNKIINHNKFNDIQDFNLINNFIKKTKPHVIFHFAAQSLVTEGYLNPFETFKTNILGTLNILESIKNKEFVKTLIIATTDKVYKDKNSKKYNEHDELDGYDPYSSSKVCKEFIAKAYQNLLNNFKKKKFVIATARSGNVIGGGDFSKNRLVPDILYSLNNKKKLVIRNPNHIRPWQHVIEPLYGYLLLAEKNYRGKCYASNNSWNFGPSKKSYINVEKVVNLMIKNEKRIKIQIIKSNFHETKVLKLNSKKSENKLNWKQKWSINQTLSKIIEWNNASKINNNKLLDISKKQILEYLNSK